MQVVASVSPAGTVAPFEALSYTLIVSNPGSADSGTVVITDQITNLVPGSPSCGSVPGCTLHEVDQPLVCEAVLLFGQPDFEQPCGQGATLTWTIASVPAGTTSFDLAFSAGVPSGATTSVTNSATWNGAGCASADCTSNQTVSPVANVVVIPSGLQPGGATPVVHQGQAADFGLLVENRGNAEANGISVFYTLPCQASVVGDNGPTCIGPGSITYVPDSATCNGSAGCAVQAEDGCALAGLAICAGTTLVWSLASIPSGTALDLGFSGMVNGPSPGTNNGSVSVAAWWNGGRPHGTLAYAPGVAAAQGPPTLAIGDACYGTELPDAGVPACSSVTAAYTFEPLAIQHATTVPTGEPWAGSGSLDTTALAIGTGLLGLGVHRRHRVRRASNR